MVVSEGLDAVARLVAIGEIQALKYRYWRACDTKDVAGFRACFVAAGAHVGLGAIGDFDNADDAAAAFERLGCQQVDGEYAVLDMHHGIHPVIEVHDAISAHGTWTLRLRHVDRVRRLESVLTGEYEDDYVVEAGRWRIRSSRFTTWWSMTRPLLDVVLSRGGVVG